MKAFHVSVLAVVTLGMLAACDKGGNRCAAPGCATEEAVIRAKCETMQKDAERGLSFKKLNDVRSKSSSSSDDVVARKIVTKFSTSGKDPGAVGLGQPLGADNGLTRMSLINDMTLAQLTGSEKGSGMNVDGLEIISCNNDRSRRDNPKQLPTVRIAEGVGTMTYVKGQKVVVELNQESLDSINANRPLQLKVDSYKVTLEAKKSKDKVQAEKDEKAGATKIQRTTEITLIPVEVLEILRTKLDNDPSRELEARQMLALGLKTGKIKQQRELRKTVIVEETITQGDLESRESESVSASLLENLVLVKGADKVCKLNSPVDTKNAVEGKVSITAEQLSALSAAIADYMINDNCATSAAAESGAENSENSENTSGGSSLEEGDQCEIAADEAAETEAQEGVVDAEGNCVPAVDAGSATE